MRSVRLLGGITPAWARAMIPSVAEAAFFFSTPSISIGVQCQRRYMRKDGVEGGILAAEVEEHSGPVGLVEGG